VTEEQDKMMLCLGGSASGREFSLGYRCGVLEVPVYERMPVRYIAAMELPLPSSPKTECYRATTMRWGGEDHRYWIPYGVPEEATASYVMRVFEDAVREVARLKEKTR
jgi:hypothetical protein